MKIKYGPAGRKIGLKQQKNGGRRRKKKMQSPVGCAEENGGTAQIKYGREVVRRLPPTRIIERNDR